MHVAGEFTDRRVRHDWDVLDAVLLAPLGSLPGTEVACLVDVLHGEGDELVLLVGILHRVALDGGAAELALHRDVGHLHLAELVEDARLPRRLPVHVVLAVDHVHQPSAYTVPALLVLHAGRAVGRERGDVCGPVRVLGELVDRHGDAVQLFGDLPGDLPVVPRKDDTLNVLDAMPSWHTDEVGWAAQVWEVWRRLGKLPLLDAEDFGERGGEKLVGGRRAPDSADAVQVRGVDFGEFAEGKDEALRE